MYHDNSDTVTCLDLKEYSPNLVLSPALYPSRLLYCLLKIERGVDGSFSSEKKTFKHAS